MLSPLLFSVYTNELQIKSNTACLFKYADDMVLEQLCSENPLLSEQIYFQNVVVLEDWCKLSALHINVKKTKEVIFSCNSGKHHGLKELKLHEQAVEIVESFKYLGTYQDKFYYW